MDETRYLMENDEEALRLDLKTDDEVTRRDARWAGLEPGMRVVDVGCGSGKTTSKLASLAQPGGEAVGLDLSDQRVSFAREQYADSVTSFTKVDLLKPLEVAGRFDFGWVRFLLEYHRTGSAQIVKNVSRILKPGGILCLIDLDHNCLNHFGQPARLERAVAAIVGRLELERDFDPYAGRKLYALLYDLGYLDIRVKMEAHHLIYGRLSGTDEFNWGKKIAVAAKESGYDFGEYEGGYREFVDEFRTFFKEPRRFTYTPMICCRGRKP
ncbi:hypothetical protein GMSM_07580 [Geomonas sp. Red276]